MKNLLFSMAILAMVASSAAADPYYWDFSGPVTLSSNVPGVDMGDTLIGRFRGDPTANTLAELEWWTSDNGSLASPLYQTDFSGYTILAVDNDYISAYRTSPFDSIVFDPLPGGDYYSQAFAVNLGTGVLQVKSLTYTMTPVPLPAAVLLGLLGLGAAGLKLRKSV